MVWLALLQAAIKILDINRKLNVVHLPGTEKSRSYKYHFINNASYWNCEIVFPFKKDLNLIFFTFSCLFIIQVYIFIYIGLNIIEYLEWILIVLFMCWLTAQTWTLTWCDSKDFSQTSPVTPNLDSKWETYKHWSESTQSGLKNAI